MFLGIFSTYDIIGPGVVISTMTTPLFLPFSVAISGDTYQRCVEYDYTYMPFDLQLWLIVVGIF